MDKVKGTHDSDSIKSRDDLIDEILERYSIQIGNMKGLDRNSATLARAQNNMKKDHIDLQTTVQAREQP